jgi:hypothetical protein
MGFSVRCHMVNCQISLYGWDVCWHVLVISFTLSQVSLVHLGLHSASERTFSYAIPDGPLRKNPTGSCNFFEQFRIACIYQSTVGDTSERDSRLQTGRICLNTTATLTCCRDFSLVDMKRTFPDRPSLTPTQSRRANQCLCFDFLKPTSWVTHWQ